MTCTTLPNLRWFGFRGASADLEAFLPRMTAPFLKRLEINFFNEPTFSIPHLQQLVNTSERLRSSSAGLAFEEGVVNVVVGSDEEAKVDGLSLGIECGQLDRQLASTAQICSALGTVFSAVEYLALGYMRHTSPNWSNEANPTQWRELLRPFNRVKTLRVPDELVWALSRSLQSEGEESPMELLPELKELVHSGSHSYARDAFAEFIDSRQNTGHPVTWVHL
ncbi:hypothetical protein BJV74DRAFT_627135 [Russula compacta]|nr:hypothetical protein BJV74DRAFT_627135 [Russula compacta]